MAKDLVNKGQFLPGKSGNPVGRPKGSKNKATIRRELALGKADKILHKALPSVVQKLVALAQEGDTTAMKLILDRTVAPKNLRGDAEGGAHLVQITIQNLTSPHAEDQPGVTINGTQAK